MQDLHKIQITLFALPLIMLSEMRKCQCDAQWIVAQSLLTSKYDLKCLESKKLSWFLNSVSKYLNFMPQL